MTEPNQTTQSEQTAPPISQPTTPPVPPTLASLPELPCPNCGANILEHHGFYNYCTETQSLREDSYLYWTNGRVFMEHDESGYETDSHECQATAFCSSCDNELPWSLFEIRAIDGETLDAAKTIIADLIAQAQEETAAETQPEAREAQDADALSSQPAGQPEGAIQ